MVIQFVREVVEGLWVKNIHGMVCRRGSVSLGSRIDEVRSGFVDTIAISFLSHRFSSSKVYFKTIEYHKAMPTFLSPERLDFMVARVIACSSSSAVNGVSCAVTCLERPGISGMWMPLSC